MGIITTHPRPGTAGTGPATRSDIEAIAWLYRRAGFGATAAELSGHVGGGIEAALRRLTDPDAAGVATTPIPWAGEDFATIDKPRREAGRIIAAWLTHQLDSPRPLEQRLTMTLHGWLVSSLDKVRNLELMARQIRLYQASTDGPFPELLKAVSRDAAMLWYLDGRDSTAEHPNENYGRELLELFALGVGHYTEADVQAASRALTGWYVRAPRRVGQVGFDRRSHDDRPQTLLGVSGVHDVDGVVDAIVAHPAHATFVATRIAAEYLGAAHDDDVATIADAYVSSGHRLPAAVGAALRLGLAGRGSPILLAPMTWLLAARRVTGAAPPVPPKVIVATGHVPLLPPNVAGWPGGRAWLATSTMVARTQLAALVARATPPDSPVLAACADGSAADVARQLGLPGPLSPTTWSALSTVREPARRLAAALVSPEFLLS